MKNLVFYDGQCGLCDRVVQWVFNHDKKNEFVFAPLQGVTAEKVLRELPPGDKQLDTLILIENYQSAADKRIFFLGKGALRICWLLGGVWKVPGVLSFLPGWLYNWGYRIVAANRHRFFSNDSCVIPMQGSSNKFLP